MDHLTFTDIAETKNKKKLGRLKLRINCRANYKLQKTNHLFRYGGRKQGRSEAKFWEGGRNEKFAF